MRVRRNEHVREACNVASNGIERTLARALDSSRRPGLRADPATRAALRYPNLHRLRSIRSFAKMAPLREHTRITVIGYCPRITLREVDVVTTAAEAAIAIDEQPEPRAKGSTYRSNTSPS